MLKVVSGNIWSELRRKAATSKSRRAAIAYVTNSKLLPLQSGDVLVTDASNAAIAEGRTSAAVLAKYFEIGVELFSLESLHAKVAIFDDWAIIGSANASQRSETYYIEAAVITDRPELVGQVEKLVSSLANTSTPIDKSFIDRISAIRVVLQTDGQPKTGKRQQAPSLTEQRFWFLGIADDEQYPGDPGKIDDVKNDLKTELSPEVGSVDWFWWHTSARFSQKASVGDIVIDCWRPHVKLGSTKEIKVYKHAYIAKIVQEQNVKAKAFLCIWSSNSEKTALSWESFLKLKERAGVKRNLTPKSSIELTERQSSALYELWDS